MAGAFAALALAALLLPGPTPAHGQSGRKSRQVTVFGIVATPNATNIDPKLKAVAPQLRKLLPGHGFKLLDVQSKRLAAGEALTCDLVPGMSAETTLLQPLDDNGKVELRCELLQGTVTQHATVVATPPNQLFFCDKKQADGTRLLIGIGAR